MNTKFSILFGSGLSPSSPTIGAQGNNLNTNSPSLVQAVKCQPAVETEVKAKLRATEDQRANLKSRE